MINNSNQNRKMWKYLLLFPALGLFFIGLSSSTFTEKVLEKKSLAEPVVQQETTKPIPPSKPKYYYEEENGKKLFVIEKDGQKDKDEVFMVVEKFPKFPGGKEAMYKFLRENLKYPKTAEKNKVQGKVYINFIVAKDGTIANANVIRGVDSDLDKEALRVVKSMPKWTPGTQRGKKVNVSFTVPVNFVLK